jgi:hypothetical protein
VLHAASILKSSPEGEDFSPNPRRDDKLVGLMGHGSKEIIYEVYGKYVDGLEKDAGKIKDYLAKISWG